MSSAGKKEPWKFITKAGFDDMEVRALAASRYESTEGMTCEECKVVTELGLLIPPTDNWVQKCTCDLRWGQVLDARQKIIEASEKVVELGKEERLKRNDPMWWRNQFEAKVKEAIEGFAKAKIKQEDHAKDAELKERGKKAGRTAKTPSKGKDVTKRPAAVCGDVKKTPKKGGKS